MDIGSIDQDKALSITGTSEVRAVKNHPLAGQTLFLLDPTYLFLLKVAMAVAAVLAVMDLMAILAQHLALSNIIANSLIYCSYPNDKEYRIDVLWVRKSQNLESSIVFYDVGSWTGYFTFGQPDNSPQIYYPSTKHGILSRRFTRRKKLGSKRYREISQ